MTASDALRGLARAIEITGVVTMVIGFAVAAVMAARELRRRDPHDIYRAARHRLGRAILLGLELLVAADIILTVTHVPTLEQVALLAAIVGIRTFLSFALDIELTGRWPWRAAEVGADARGQRAR